MTILECFPYNDKNQHKYVLRYIDKCNRCYDLAPYQINSDGISTTVMLKCIETKSNPITYSYQKLMDTFDGFSKIKFYNQRCERLDVQGVALEDNYVIIVFK